MQGRKPRHLSLTPNDKPVLEQIARSRTLPWFQVQRARALLAMAAGERIQTLAWQLQCSPSTLWRLGRRYEQVGLEKLLVEAPRVGRPSEISPPATGATGSAGVSGTDCSGSSHHPLVE